MGLVVSKGIGWKQNKKHKTPLKRPCLVRKEGRPRAAMENWVRGWYCRWVSSFNILLIKKWPGGDIEQVIPVGSLGVSCPTFPQRGWSSSEGMHRAQQAAVGLGTAVWGGFCCRPACGQLVSSLLLAILSAFWTAFLVLLDIMGVGPLRGLISASEAGGAGFVVCFALCLKSKDWFPFYGCVNR